MDVYSSKLRLEMALKMDGSLVVLSGDNRDSEKIDLLAKVVKSSDIHICSFEKNYGKYGFWQSVLCNSIMYICNLDTSIPSEFESKLIVLEYFSKGDKVLVIKDIQNIENEAKKKISYGIKDVIRKSIKIVVFSDLNHELDLVKLNPDLNGRVQFIK